MNLFRLSTLGFFAGTIIFAADTPPASPAKNWVSPHFTKEGYHTVTARGSEARLTGPRQFEVVDLNLTLFRGDATNVVDTVLLAPAATFFPDEKIARGDRSVRLIRDDVEAAGTRWTCRQSDRRVTLDGEVRVVFRAALGDILK